MDQGRALVAGPIARASGVSVGIRLAGLALSFAQAVLVARLLKPSGYGSVALVIAIVTIVATVCQSGLGALAVREVPALLARDDRSSVRGFIGFSATVVIGLGAIATIALAWVSYATNLPSPAFRPLLGIGALTILPIAIIALLHGLAQGFGRVVQAQVPGQIIRPAALTLAMLLSLIAGLRITPRDYMMACVIAIGVAAIIAMAWLWTSERPIFSAPKPSGPQSHHAKAALPFLGLAITYILLSESNTLLLGWLSGPRETGLFQPVIRLAPVLMLPVYAAGMGFAPRVAELWQRGEVERIRSITATFTWTTTVITLATALTIAVAGPWIMLVFGPEFQESAPLLWIVGAAHVFSAACGPVGMLLLMERKGGRALSAQIVALAANGALGLVLIPRLGALGAAISLSGGLAVWTGVMLILTISRYRFDPTVLGLVLRKSRTTEH